jgi:uncharacterized membrane protein
MWLRKRFGIVIALGIYILYISRGYIEEKLLATELRQRAVEEDVVLMMLHCGGAMSVCFAFALLPRTPPVKRLLEMVGVFQMIEWLFGKRKYSLSAPPTEESGSKQRCSGTMYKPAVKRMKFESFLVEKEHRQMRYPKMFFFFVFLSIANVLSHLFAYRALRYTSYPNLIVVRAFKRFPLQLPMLKTHKKGRLCLHRRSVASLLLVLGIFIFVFVQGDKTNGIDLAPGRRSVEAMKNFSDVRKRKIVGSIVEFVSYKIEKIEKGADLAGLEEQALLEGVMRGERVGRETAQEMLNYKSLVDLYNNRIKGGFSKDARNILQTLNSPQSDQYRSVLNSLFFSLIELLQKDRNVGEFNVFVERCSVKCACYLCCYAWMSVVVDGGETLLFKSFKVDFVLILFATNLLSMLIGLLVFVFSSEKIENIIRVIELVAAPFSRKKLYTSLGPNLPKVQEVFKQICFFLTRDAMFVILINPLAKLLVYRAVAKKSLAIWQGVDIGRKFFAVLFSIFLYSHNFATSHYTGLFLMFFALILDSSINKMFFSAKSLSLLYRRKGLAPCPSQ